MLFQVPHYSPQNIDVILFNHNIPFSFQPMLSSNKLQTLNNRQIANASITEAQLGDQVTITHTRPLSKTKHFYLSAINQRRLESSIPSTSSTSSTSSSSSTSPSTSVASGLSGSTNIQRDIPLKAGSPSIPKAKTVSQARKRELAGKESGWDISVIPKIYNQNTLNEDLR